MAAITKEQALQLAARHIPSTSLGHPDYRLVCDVSGRIGDGWLFAYRVECLKDIPLEEWERFAGGGGFIVSSSGEIQTLSVPMFIEAERKVDRT
jgi:hypothetical protein